MKTHLEKEDSILHGKLRTACGRSVREECTTTVLSDVECLTCMQSNYYDKREKEMRENQGGKDEFIEEEENDSATDKQVGGAWYKKYDIQPIEFVMQNEDALHPTDAFMLNNVLKYCLRHREKNGVEDLEKAIHYIELVKEHTYEEET